MGQPAGDGINSPGEGWGRLCHGPLGLQVVCTEEGYQLGGGELVELLTEWIGLFGEQMAPVSCGHRQAHSSPSS